MVLAVLLRVPILVWVAPWWGARGLVVTGVVATLGVLLAFLLASPGHLALHQVVRADVTYVTFHQGPYWPQPHTYTLTDGSSLAHLARMLNALPALSGQPPCERTHYNITGGPPHYAAATILLRTSSGERFGFDFTGFYGVVMADQQVAPSVATSLQCDACCWFGPDDIGCHHSTYYADAYNTVLGFLRAHITAPCGTWECPATPLPIFTPDGNLGPGR